MTLRDIKIGDVIQLEYPGRGFVKGILKHDYPDGSVVIQEGRCKPRFFHVERIVNITLVTRSRPGRAVPEISL